MNRWRCVTALALAALGLSCTPLAFAQAPGEPKQMQQPASAYSDSELRSFAVATLDLRRISDSYQPKLEAAKNAEEETQVKQAATGEMVQAIEKAGLSVDKFQEISRQAQDNPDLLERVKGHLTDAQAK